MQKNWETCNHTWGNWKNTKPDGWSKIDYWRWCTECGAKQIGMPSGPSDVVPANMPIEAPVNTQKIIERWRKEDEYSDCL